MPWFLRVRTCLAIQNFTLFDFAVSWGMPFAGIFLALRSAGEEVSLTRLSMLANFTGLAVNIVANYILIFGKLGLPAMGGVGCGWATAISMFAMMITMALLLQKSRVCSPPL